MALDQASCLLFELHQQPAQNQKTKIIRLFAIEFSVMLQSLSSTGLKTQKLFLDGPACWEIEKTRDCKMVKDISRYSTRDPYSFFTKVVSRASKPDDTLVSAKIGLASHDLPRSLFSKLKSSHPPTHCSVQ